jgi:hypothetical protein
MFLLPFAHELNVSVRVRDRPVQKLDRIKKSVVCERKVG